jgi:dienelactone hydrolase
MKGVKADRIGVGLVHGRRYALLLASTSRASRRRCRTRRAPADPAAIARIKAPVLGNYGGDDQGPPAQVREFEAP